MKKKIILNLIACILLTSINGCNKDNSFIPLYINNITIDEIDGEYDKGFDIIFKAEYKDTQTLKCTIETLFLITGKEEELKITGISAYYDGKINMYIDTNIINIDEAFKLVPSRICFEITGNGLNNRKSDFLLNLNGHLIDHKVN